ncbi:MAG TPA: hypothetical protein VM324_05625 [Egibacteraceae bacterium]|nr:hypothetical protein [Egibacteraceae bacterium]
MTSATPAITAGTSHEQLYVAATRGARANHLWVIVDADREVVRDDMDLPAPEQILSRILARTDPDRLSAHQVIQDSLRESTSLARLGAIFEDAARTATDHWLRHTLTERGLGAAAGDPQWPALITRARETALAGHDLAALLDEAITLRPIGDAHSAAAVLHWRLGVLGANPAPRARGPLASLPPADGLAIDVARQAGELMRHRWRDLRATLAATSEPLPWAPALGPRAADPTEQSAWLTAATAVTAYRERYEVPDHTPMLGSRPAASRPDARSAWDHACIQADRYLARRLHHLDDQALADLDARQQTILDNPPCFDPNELERGRQRRDANQVTTDPRRGRISHREQLLVQRLERAARAHQDWRRAAADALAIRRQVTLELVRRRELTPRPMAVRLTR